MKKCCLLLSFLGILLMACQQDTRQKVTEQEKKEIHELDSLLNDLVKNKSDLPASESKQD